MTSRWVWPALAAGAALVGSACSSRVTVFTDPGAGGAASSSISTWTNAAVTTADGVPDPCSGPQPTCFNCAAGMYVAPTCTDSWFCPPATVNDPSQCMKPCPPPFSCDGKLGAQGCGYSCNLAEACVHEGPTPVCTSCPDKAIHQVGAYQCACDAAGHMECKLIPGCCTGKDPFECGDALAMDCVAHRCVMPPGPGQCWQDSDCPGGGICTNDILCPCGAQCKMGDKPGYCLKK